MIRPGRLISRDEEWEATRQFVVGGTTTEAGEGGESRGRWSGPCLDFRVKIYPKVNVLHLIFVSN